MISYTITEARNHFTSLVHAVEESSSVEITRHGEPVAVIFSIHEYRAFKDEAKDFWTEYLEFCAQNNMTGASMTDASFTDDDFANLRDRSPGREVSLWH